MPPCLLDLVYIPLALLYLPRLLYQMIIQRTHRQGWRERFGLVNRRPRPNDKPCIWIHAVSLGEINATRVLVAEIERRLPAYDIVISATTDTGYAAACSLYRPKYVFRYPLDFSFAVHAVLNRLRPNAIILMELEVWPNLVTIAQRRNIPVGIANGRITEERSMRRFRWPVVHSLARSIFTRIAWIAAQNETYAGRFEELAVSADRLHVTGSMKYDTAVFADAVPGEDTLAQALKIDVDSPLFVAGSTGPGEEEVLIEAFKELRTNRADLQCAVIPRKPERFDEVARLIEAGGCTCRRRSEHPDQTPQDDSETAVTKSGKGPVVILGDTMGELRKFYALADVVFVGRSLVPLGGSDLMEVAGLGRPMCFGPYIENFADVADQLIADDAAVRLGDADELVSVIRRLLDDADTTRAMGRRARDVVHRNTGATAQTVDLLCESLGCRADHPASSISTAKLR